MSRSVQDKTSWIRDGRTGEPMPPRRQPGYYPGFSTLGQKSYWDAATREVVRKRTAHVPEIRFFTDKELPVITAVFDRLLPQDDRLPEFRIPIVPVVDARLFHKKIDGYRYADMPDDWDAYRLGIRAIEQTAQAMHGDSFPALDTQRQDEVLKTIHDKKEVAAKDIWARMNIKRFWALLVQDAIGAYYAHPWAWDEVGFGGPAYPRAYTRLEGGLPEPWEVNEIRYEWHAPPNSLSDAYQDDTEPFEEQSHPGQGGTH